MIRVNGKDFDNRQGVILKPEVGAIAFRNSATAGIGGQVTEKRGPEFTLTLTRYDPANQIENLSDFIRGSIGKLVTITETFNGQDTEYFSFVNGRLQFFVTQARIIERSIVARACGWRKNVQFDHSPACKVVSQWTFYAVEIIP